MARLPMHKRPAFLAASPAALRRGAFAAPAAAQALSSRRPAVVVRRVRRASGMLVMQIGIFFSTTTGNTEEVAGMVKDALGDAAADPQDVADISAADMGKFDHLVVGAPTWNTGEDEMRSGTAWDDFLYDDLPSLDLTGKNVAVFGLGDADGYADYFVDAMAEVHDCFAKAGATMIGAVDASAYEFSESKSVRDGKFVGLPIDNVNDSASTEERVAKWVADISPAMGV